MNNWPIDPALQARANLEHALGQKVFQFLNFVDNDAMHTQNPIGGLMMGQETGLEQIGVLFAQASQVEGVYTRAIEDFASVLFSRLDVSELEKGELMNVFLTGVLELRKAMFHSGVTIGYSLSQLGLGDAAVNLVTQAYRGGDGLA